MREVIICGAGPTGLTLAIHLQKKKLPYRLVDQKSGPTTHSKALGIHARTLEVFEQLGCLQPFLEKGMQANEIHIHCGDKEHLLQLKSIHVLFLPQSDTETILIEHLRSLGGRVEWNTPLQTLAFTDEDWIIGCDGAHSYVRELMAVNFSGAEFAENFFLADVEIETKITTPHFYLQPNGLLALVPLYKNSTFLRIICPLRAGERVGDLDELLNLRFGFNALRFKDHFDEGLHQPSETIAKGPLLSEERSDWCKDSRNEFEYQNVKPKPQVSIKKGCSFPPIRSIVWSSQFHIHRRLVNHMRKNRFLLAGDAAHIHSPVGGQGMNTSIQDAHNLGWKLALELQGKAAPSLLDSYERERLPVAKRVLRSTTFATHLITFFSRTGCTSLFSFLLLFLRLPFVNNFLAKALSELYVSYKKSPLTLWKGPKVGQCSRHLASKNLNFVIVIFSEQTLPSSEWIEVVLVQDPHLLRYFHASDNSIYVIRPDGVIGYREKNFDEKKLRSYFNRVLS